ncbi:MAG: hypothetical protein M3Z85_19990, partial [Acidobacteriota bacterium]|nr:hypothetical protein [Acidobacteriota bacterium]
HLQTVSVFSPHMVLDSRIAETIFRHPALDFANTHFYEEGTIDHPSNTVDPAVATGKLTREAISQVDPRRPFFDSEHGPIHTYKDQHKSLPEPFDDEYFRHMQWAHFASGGAGGGMRWPNRKPHILTPGMHRAQRALANILSFIDWEHFKRSSLNLEPSIEDRKIKLFGCGDSRQVIIWILRADIIGPRGMLDRNRDPLQIPLRIPGLIPGSYNITAWDTQTGATTSIFDVPSSIDGQLCFDSPPVFTDLALAIRYSGALE